MRKYLNIGKSLVYLAVVIVCGCGDVSTGDAAKDTSFQEYPELTENAVLVKVDGRELSKRELEKRIDGRIAVLKAANKSMKSTKRDVLARRYYRMFYSQFLPKALYLNAAEREGVKPSEEDMAIVRAETVKALGSELIRSYSWFKKHLKPHDFSILETECAENAVILAYWRHLAPDAFVVTEEELEAIRKKTVAMNAKSEEARIRQLEKAREIVRKLKGGEDFAKTAAKESVTAEEDEAGGVWGEFEPKEIPYDEIKALVAKMKPGDVSDPLELEDGIHIIKLISRQGTDSVSVFNPDELTVTLARIVLQLPMTYAMGSIEEIRRDMRMQKLEPMQKAWLKDLRSKANVSYPSGTNLWNFLNKRAPERKR